MELDTVKKLLADWVEKEVILKVYDGAEKYMMLFALPFKMQELGYKVEDNRETLEAWGLLDKSGVNLDKLEDHAVATMEKCGSVSMDLGSKTLKFCADDVRNALRHIRGCAATANRSDIA